jgi:ribokinase
MPDARFDVLSYGTLGIDRILRVPHWPGPDVSTHTVSETVHLGGKATNTAANLATWGVSVAISGTMIGDDDIGRQFLEKVKEYPAIDTEFVGLCQGQASMYCLILVNCEGERAIIGVNTDQISAVTPTHEMIASARVLTLDLYGGAERVEAARLAYEIQRPVVIGDLRNTAHPVLPYATVVIASAAEIQMSYPNKSAADFAHDVIGHGPQVVVVTNGGQSASVFTEKAEVQLMPPEVKVVDTTGAGDAVRAGVTFGVLRGLSPIECAAYGIAAGSLSVRREGGSGGSPSRGELSALSEMILRSATPL